MEKSKPCVSTVYFSSFALHLITLVFRKLIMEARFMTILSYTYA